jgi:hypothetical protein
VKEKVEIERVARELDQLRSIRHHYARDR